MPTAWTLRPTILPVPEQGGGEGKATRTPFTSHPQMTPQNRICGMRHL